jgi:transcriptional regulator with XRE-family HTH domain
MSFHERLYNLRKERKMSQEDLAEIVGVSRQAVQKWESGTSNPDMNNLLTISNYFGVSLDQLIRDDLEPEVMDKKSVDQKETRMQFVTTSHRLCYEYKSSRKLFGLPLVHVNIGFGLCKAKGIIAIGNVAIGFLSIGGLSLGLFALGGLALGILALAGLSLGIIAVGGISAGIIAIGGISIGFLSFGGVAIGKYCIGGVAAATDIAFGGVARGHIAIGDKVHGAITIIVNNTNKVSANEIRNIILKEYPEIWRPILHLFTQFF